MQSGASFRLVVRRGPQPNQQFLLTRDTVTIGRDITNDIVINDPEVSRHHARLIRTPNGYTFEDLRSTNGSFINRQRLASPFQMTNGDLIGLGETITLAYEVMGEIPASTMVSPGGPSQPYQMPPQQPAPSPRPMQPQQPMPPQQMAYPMADEEQYQPDRNRWIVIGCGVLTLLICCAILALAIFIDSYQGGCLYCRIPVLQDLDFLCKATNPCFTP